MSAEGAVVRNDDRSRYELVVEYAETPAALAALIESETQPTH